MSEKQKETTIFDSRLREDEYIIWQGVSLRDFGFRISIGWQIFGILFVCSFITFFAIRYTGSGFIDEILDMYGDLFFGLFSVCFLLALAFGGANLEGKVNDPPKDRSYLILPWHRFRYAITNQRILILRSDNFREISLILMQDAVKTKPRNGKANINLYDRRSPTGQLPAPIATLNNLSEEDAETAYDLLVKARDLSFEERIEDLGLE